MKTFTKVTCGLGLLSLLAIPGAALANTAPVSDSLHSPLANQKLAYYYYNGYRPYYHYHYRPYRYYYRGYSCVRCRHNRWGERFCWRVC